MEQTSGQNEKKAELARIAEKVAACTLCRLHSTRTKVVPGEGNPDASLMFVGEAPGFNEDKQGRPFVGRAGQLLTRMIEAMGFTREQVFIGNVLKCRPPDNRDPQPDEVAMCSSYIIDQIEIIQPKVICCLGAHSARLLTGDRKAGIGSLRGTFFEFNGHKAMSTYHPAYLLRNPSAKKVVWEDLQKIMAYLKENT